MTILEEASHLQIIIKHDPILYEDSQAMVEYISQVMKQTSIKLKCRSTRPGIDPFLENLVKGADRVFYFHERPKPRLIAKTWLKMKDQKTLEAFS